MKLIGTPKELETSETRVAMTPRSASEIQKLGYKCLLESGAGEDSGFADDEYEAVGVEIVKDAKEIWKKSDVVIKVAAPTESENTQLSKNQIVISFIHPARNSELLEQSAKNGSTLIAMDMVPRISRAQKMDALSSMANIAGYRSVIEASNTFGSFLGGQITAAGKVAPAKVLVIGAGVAGLAAIGAARSMGAIVRAFDVRPEVAEQIESMSAEFLFLDFEDSDSSQDSSKSGGYASPSSPEFREKQLELFRTQAMDTDIVITTALIPGREAPKLWLADMVDSMKSGSVIVDLAAEQGGNCDYTKAGKAVVTDNGVTILGYTDLASRMAPLASSLYATNVRHMIADLTPDKDGVINHNMEDDVICSSTVAHSGKISYPPPPLKVQAIAGVSEKSPVKEMSKEEKEKEARAQQRRAGIREVALLVFGALALIVVGSFAPRDFMQHLIVFVLACFVGFQVIWNVSHALHTPLMSVTNAISGIIVVGALLQVENSNWIISVLAAISLLIATINIVGGFAVTRRMLAMFQKSGD